MTFSDEPDQDDRESDTRSLSSYVRADEPLPRPRHYADPFESDDDQTRSPRDSYAALAGLDEVVTRGDRSSYAASGEMVAPSESSFSAQESITTIAPPALGATLARSRAAAGMNHPASAPISRLGVLRPSRASRPSYAEVQPIVLESTDLAEMDPDLVTTEERHVAEPPASYQALAHYLFDDAPPKGAYPSVSQSEEWEAPTEARRSSVDEREARRSSRPDAMESRRASRVDEREARHSSRADQARRTSHVDEREVVARAEPVFDRRSISLEDRTPIASMLPKLAELQEARQRSLPGDLAYDATALASNGTTGLERDRTMGLAPYAHLETLQSRAPHSLPRVGSEPPPPVVVPVPQATLKSTPTPPAAPESWQESPWVLSPPASNTAMFSASQSFPGFSNTQAPTARGQKLTSSSQLGVLITAISAFALVGLFLVVGLFIRASSGANAASTTAPQPVTPIPVSSPEASPVVAPQVSAWEPASVAPPVAPIVIAPPPAPEESPAPSAPVTAPAPHSAKAQTGTPKPVAIAKPVAPKESASGLTPMPKPKSTTSKTPSTNGKTVEQILSELGEEQLRR